MKQIIRTETNRIFPLYKIFCFLVPQPHQHMDLKMTKHCQSKLLNEVTVVVDLMCFLELTIL